MKTIKGFESCNRKKLFVVITLNLFLCCSATGRSSPSVNNHYDSGSPALNMQVNDWLAFGDWILDKTAGNVDFYYRIAECRGLNVVLLKFDNRNNHPVKISWKEMFVTRQVAAKSQGGEGVKVLILPPGETSSSGCEDTKNKVCIILPGKAIPTYKADIINYEFKDIAVDAP